MRAEKIHQKSDGKRRISPVNIVKKRPERPVIAVFKIFDNSLPEGIIHNGIKFFSAEIFASDAVRDLVGSVFPYFAVKHGIGVFTFHRFADLAYKPVAQFIGDVKPEPADPLPHPFFDNSAFAADKLPV